MLLLAIFVVLLPLYFYKTGGGRIEKVVKEVRHIIETSAEVAFEEFHFTEREKGERKWEVWADRAERFTNDARVHFDGVRMEFLLKAGDWSRLTGREGDYFENDKRVVVSGDVKVETDSGYSLYADRMVWEAQEGVLRSDAPVRLLTAQYMVRGDRMVFRAEERKVEVEGGVRAVISGGPKKDGGQLSD